MNFYVQINADGYITDCIEYPYSDYIKCDFDVPLPDKFISGCYRFIDSTTYELDVVKLREMETPAIEERIAAIEAAILELGEMI